MDRYLNGIIHCGEVYIAKGCEESDRACDHCDLWDSHGDCKIDNLYCSENHYVTFRYSHELTDKINGK